jgi:hypothetical protein
MVRVMLLATILLGMGAPSALAASPIANEAEARAVLERQGVVPGPLEHVGDYWQGRARAHGKRVYVDLFDDGTLWVLTRPEVTLKAVESRNGVLRHVS